MQTYSDNNICNYNLNHPGKTYYMSIKVNKKRTYIEYNATFAEACLEPSRTSMLKPFAKIAVNYFEKSTSLQMLNWVLYTPLIYTLKSDLSLYHCTKNKVLR